MRLTLALALIGSLVLTAWVGASSLAKEEVRTGEPREGDTYRYDLSTRLGDAPADALTRLVKLEGPSSAIDRYGIPRETEAVLVQEMRGEAVTRVSRCHSVPGAVTPVRLDHLQGGTPFGWGYNMSSTVAGLRLDETEHRWEGEILTSFQTAPCEGRAGLAPRTYEEGERLSFGEVEFRELRLPYGGWTLSSVPSAPGVATRFHDRDAISFSFDLLEEGRERTLKGRATVVYAEGVPGAALVAFEGTYQSLAEDSATRGPLPLVVRRELTGYIAGDGPVIGPRVWEPPIQTNPHATFTQPGRDRFDDAAFGFPYPLEEALAAIRADPALDFDAWMYQHPEAALSIAIYDRRMSYTSSALPFVKEGGWFLAFVEAGSEYWVTTTRASALDSPLGPLATPEKVVVNQGGPRDTVSGWPHRMPGRVPTSESMRSLIATHGFDPQQIERFWWYLGVQGNAPTAYISFTNVSYSDPAAGATTNGAMFTLEALSGGMTSLASDNYVQRSSGLLADVFPGARDPSWQRTFAEEGVGVIPAWGTGLALGAAALGAAALLFVAAKFLLIPLYTRLRRDRLLDNPVRARMYECIRANPGIHRAEIIDFMGVGQATTRHHLDKLVEARFVSELPTGGFVRYYAAGEIPPDLARREAVLRAGSNRSVFDLLAAEPHLTLREAAARLGMSAPSVHRCVKQLREAGLIPAAGAGERTVGMGGVER